MEVEHYFTGLTGLLWIALIFIFVVMYQKERARIAAGGAPVPSMNDVTDTLDRLESLRAKTAEAPPESTLKWRSREGMEEEISSSSSDAGSNEESQEGEECEETEGDEEEEATESSDDDAPKVRGVKMQFVVLNKGSKSVRKIDPLTIARDAAGLAVKNIVRLRAIKERGCTSDDKKGSSSCSSFTGSDVDERGDIPSDWFDSYIQWSTRGVTKISLRCDTREDFDWVVKHAQTGSEDVGVPPSLLAKPKPKPKKAALAKKDITPPSKGDTDATKEGASVEAEVGDKNNVDVAGKESTAAAVIADVVKEEQECGDDSASSSEPSRRVGRMPVSILEYHKDAVIAAIGPYYADDLAVLTGHLKLLA
jgi:hypothetical protein